MKSFLTALTTSCLVLAANVSADETQVYDCSTMDIAKATTNLTVATKKQLPEITTQVSEFLNTCRSRVFPTVLSPKNHIEDFYNLVNKLLLAQLKIGNSHDCIALGVATTEAWNSPAKIIKDSLYIDLQKAIASCKAKREKEINAKFSAEKCGLFGAQHKYSSAIAVPSKWKLTKDSACLYLYGGKNRDRPEEEGIRLRKNYPYLILLTLDGENLQEQFIDFAEGELASNDICLSGRIGGSDFLSTAGNAKNKLIRIKSYSEHCLRDSASFAMDSVYKIDAEKGLLQSNELSVALHH